MDYLDRMKEFEGYTPRAAWDYKQHTNGYGTRARHPGEIIDRDEAERRFQAEAEKAGAFVDSLGVPMTPGQRAALTDLTFNAGTKWAESGLGNAVRSGDWDAAADTFTQYNKAGGETLPGLVSRRQQGAAWMRGNDMQFAGIGANGRPNALSNPNGPQQGPAPQGAFANMSANLAKSPVGILASGLERGDSSDISSGLSGTGDALGAFGKSLGGGGGEEEDKGAAANAMAQAGAEANAAAISSGDQAQAQALQAMMARHQRPGAFA